MKDKIFSNKKDRIKIARAKSLDTQKEPGNVKIVEKAFTLPLELTMHGGK